VIYLDTSVALAFLLADDRAPPESLWRESLVASRLIEYEAWNRLHVRRLARSHGEHLRAVVGRIAMLELNPHVVTRALEPFPTPVRTLDALHLASIEFLRGRGQTVELASYDERMIAAAAALGIRLYPPIEA
jgi:predicted nucleic acid-binding protein